VTVSAGTGDVLGIAQIISNTLGLLSTGGGLMVDTVASGGTAGAAPNGTSELIVGGSGGFTSVPGGWDFIVDASSGATSIVAGSGTEVIGGSAGGAYFVGGNSTIAATGGDNILVATSLPGGSTYLLSGTPTGNDTMNGFGTGTIAGGTGANLMFQTGGGVVSSQGNDTIVASGGSSSVTASGSALIFGDFGSVAGSQLALSITGANDTVSTGISSSDVTLQGSGALVFGSVGTPAGALNVLDEGSNDTVSGLNSPTTITAGTGSQGLWAFGGAGGLTFVGGSALATVVSGSGPASVVAGTGGVVMASNSDDTVVGSTGASTLFGSANHTLSYSGSGALEYVALDGNETLGAAGSTGNNVLFASTVSSANDLIISGTGADTFVAGGGADTLAGGGGSNTYYFLEKYTTGQTDFITDLTSNDQVNLIGYDSTKSSVSSENGSTTLTLSDNTKITFVNLSNLNGTHINYG
jgi:Ca2+-binding RTX toxin-like protein